MSRTSAVIIMGSVASMIALATLHFWFASSGGRLLSGPSGALIALGRLSGLFLTLLIGVQLILASRMPLLDKLPGALPLRLHRLIGFSIPAIVLAHVLFISLGYALRDDRGIVSQFLVFVTQWEHVWLALLAVVIIILVGIVSVRRIRSRLRYETWYAIHLSLYAAIALSFFHQIETGDMAHGLARVFWIGLALAIASLFLAFRVARPALFFARHRFIVTRVVPETPSTVSIYIGGKDIERFRFEPGQYAHFTFLQKGLSAHHPFSFSGPRGAHELRITVKKLGDFTGDIEKLVPGTRVVVDGPMGRFTRANARTDRACFVAGGVGITPIASMVRSADDISRTALFVSNRSKNDAPLLGELCALGAETCAVFTESGDAPLDAGVIAARCPDIRARDVYICGPGPMMTALSEGLAALGVPRVQIHTEAFMY